jgi:predicted Fe-Mo cluster-binding NifX family protein
MKVAIPRFGEEVAPCFEYSATIAIFTIRRGRLVDQLDFAMQSREEFDRVRLLRDQRVDTLICGGVRDVFEDLLRAAGIRVISWVSGDVESLLDRFIRGELAPGTGRPGGKTGGTPSTDI